MYMCVTLMVLVSNVYVCITVMVLVSNVYVCYLDGTGE